MNQGRRIPNGETHGQAKLTYTNVKKIRSSPLPAEVLAKMYGVHVVTIKKVLRFQTWRHVP